MPEVDTTYIIGVLREWEKGFLQDDEFTRLIEASSKQEAVHTLVDTPYGKWMDEKSDAIAAFSAIDNHIKSIHTWLQDKIVDERILQFISARYDALNIATCLLQKGNSEKEPDTLSGLGLIEHNVLHSSIWNNIGWDEMPEYWEKIIKEIESDELETTAMLKVIAEKTLIWMQDAAFTPLMKAVVNCEKSKLDESVSTRPLGAEDDATEFDFVWDEKLMRTIKDFKHDPTGYDPILAFWFAKELEGKNVRLLLTAKLAGMKTQEIRKMQRSLYRSYA